MPSCIVNDVLFGHVRWQSHDGVDDCTRQPFDELCQDVPDIVRDYIVTSHDKDVKAVFEEHESSNEQQNV